jgi:hypothetical protein
MRSFETVSERDLITMIVALERMSEEFSASEAKDRALHWVNCRGLMS